jgi:uncharacterized protein (TIGR03435 family)
VSFAGKSILEMDRIGWVYDGMAMHRLSVLLIISAAASAQVPTTAPSGPVFEVASVKTAVQPERGPVFCLVPCSPGERLTLVGQRVDIRFMSLHKVIYTAYRLKPYQVKGPDWIETQRFDIIAKIPANASADQIPEMLQALLEDRFKLAIHRENKDTPVLVLVVGKNGPHLENASPDAEAVAAKAVAAPGGRGLYSGEGESHLDDSGYATSTGSPWGPVTASPPGQGDLRFELLAVTMPGLAELLTPHEDRPVIDVTGLKGRYHMQFTIELPPPSPPGDAGGGRGGRSGGPMTGDPLVEGLFQALEKSGLKLEKRTAPVATIVVDHIEKTASEN